MKPFYSLNNQIGIFYSQGQIQFDQNNLNMYSPVLNSVMFMNLDQHVSKLLNFQASYNIQLLSLCFKNEILLISDELNYLYMFSLRHQRLIGKKKFQDKISVIKFHKENKIFFIASGRFVFIYENPINLESFQYEPFLLLKKYNSASQQEIFLLEECSINTNYFLATDDNIVRLLPIFNDQNKESQINQVFEFRGHKAEIKFIKDDLSDTKKIITFDKNGLLQLWQMVKDQNTNENKIILLNKQKIFQENTSIVEVNYKHNFLLIYFNNQTFILYQVDFNSEKILNDLTTFKISNERISHSTFHSKKNLIGFAGEDGQLSVWNFQSKMFVFQQSSTKIQITNFDFSDDGQLLAIGDYKGDVRLYNSLSGYVVSTFLNAKSKITGVQFIKNNVLITSSLDGVVWAYDLNKNILFREMKPQVENQIFSLAVEKEGEIIFAGCFDPYQINIFSYWTGKLIDVIDLHTGPVSHLQFSTQKSILVSGSWDKTIRTTNIFQKDSNSEAININQRIMDIKLNKDEETFGVLTYQGEFQLYNINSNHLICLISLQKDFIKSMVVSFEFLLSQEQIVVIGSKNTMNYYDIPHWALYQKQELLLNFSFQNTKLKWNSKYITDGINTKELENKLQEKFNQFQLPGAQYFNKKQEEMEYHGVLLNKMQDNLYVVSSQGVQIMSNKSLKSYLNFQSKITKESLQALLVNKDYVQYLLCCLELQSS